MNTVFKISILRIKNMESILSKKYKISDIKPKYNDGSYAVVEYDGNGYNVVENDDLVYLRALQNNSTVKVVLKNSSFNNIIKDLLHEIKTVKLNPMRMAIYINELQNSFDVKQTDIAKNSKVTSGTISNKQRLNNLPAKVQSALFKGLIKERHGRALLRLKSVDNFEKIAENICKTIIEDNLKVSECEDIVSKQLGMKITKRRALNIKELDKKNMSKPQSQIFINHVSGEMEKTVKELNEYFPNLEIVLDEGVDKTDYVFLLRLKGING